MKKFIIVLACAFFVTVIWVLGQEKPQFSHKTHQEAEVECATCHEAATSKAPTDVLLPPMETCYQCHDQGSFGEFSYHENVPPLVTGYIAKFNHEIHLAQELKCEKCHGDVEKSEVMTRHYLPKMTQCVTCHQVSDQVGYCNTCHASQEDLRPTNHKLLTWKSAHGIESQQHLTDCMLCHTSHACAECHEGDNLDHKVHPLNYRFNHSIFAQGNKQTCLTCHEEQTSCNSCHREMMVLPKSHGFVNWSNTRKGDGGKHARTAKMDLDYCLSCHSDQHGDPICAQCHNSK